MNYEEKYKKALEWMQSLYSGLHGITKEEAEKYFPELQENKDDRIRKGLIKAVSDILKGNTLYGTDVTREEALAWLEKQGEHKPFDYENANIQQKDFAPKVEPKFKVGDWYVYKDKTYHLLSDINGLWTIEDTDGRKYSPCEPIDIDGDDFHLWSINDAKDGDVLINWNNTTFIFKAIEDETVKFHIAYNEKWDTIKTPSTKLSHLGLPEPQFEFHPATKEQRDLLFQKIKEAGYEWDSEKKELKKIESKKLDMTREEFRDKKSKDYRKHREAYGINDPVYLDEIEEAYYQGMVDADSHPHWISVEEKLPPKKSEYDDLSNNVLATNGKEIYESVYNHDFEDWFTHDMWELVNITHWMPMPQAPTCSEKPNNCEKGGEE